MSYLTYQTPRAAPGLYLRNPERTSRNRNGEPVRFGPVFAGITDGPIQGLIVDDVTQIIPKVTGHLADTDNVLSGFVSDFGIVQKDLVCPHVC